MGKPHAVSNLPPLDLHEHLFLPARWQEVLFLTYSFDLPFFESYVLPLLVQNGAKKVSVVADAAWLAERLPRWLEDREIREAGKHYTLCGVQLPGAFHPKLILAAGNQTGAVMIGSGNISSFGMSTGGELFTLQTWANGELPPLAQEAWRMCRDVGEALAIDPLFAERVRSLGAHSPKLTAEPAVHHLLHNLSESLADQFVRITRGESVETLTVWSPFTDQQLTALAALVDGLHPRQVTLGVQPELTSLDGASLVRLIAKRSDISWNTVELVHKQPRQLIHAKGILVTLSSNEDLLLVGSPNLSAPALLHTAAEANFEAAVLVRGRELCSLLFSPDGPVSFGGPIDPAVIRWSAEPTTTLRLQASRSLVLLGARWDGAELALFVRGNCPADAVALLDETDKAQVRDSNGALRVAGIGGEVPRTVRLVWQEGRSDLVIIADLPALARMASGGETKARPVPLAALDYGGDTELIAILEELARLTIISRDDVVRTVRGLGALSEQEEAAAVTAEESLLDLADIDFSRLAQHPAARSYGRHAADFDTPWLQIWLDEIVEQFRHLDASQLRIVPIGDESDSSDEGDDTDPSTSQRKPWPVSRRVRLRVWNRVRRYVSGLVDRQFRTLITPAWMAQNYALFLDFLNRLWKRANDPTTMILDQKQLHQLSLQMLQAFWGNEAQHGYWDELTEDAAYEIAIILLERKAHILTSAVLCRLLSFDGPTNELVTLVTARFLQQMEPFDLINMEAADEALLYLGLSEETPTALLQQLRETLTFSWPKYCALLKLRYQLQSVVLRNVNFNTGDALVLNAGTCTLDRETLVAIFGDWIQTSISRQIDDVGPPAEPRQAFQMMWGHETEMLYYHLEDRELIYRHIGDPTAKLQTWATNVSPSVLANALRDSGEALADAS